MEPGRRSAQLRLAASWIDYCINNHGALCRVDLRAPIPTRLIDVQAQRSGDICLIETAKQPPVDRRYIALSHCWGGLPKLDEIKTRRRTLKGYMRKIEASILPRTFQDAIDITRHLGLRYLWIDSFCIIQDDDSDWEKEASLMDIVYANAYCTIAATASSDGNGGCFVPRSSTPIQEEFEAPLQRTDIPAGFAPPAPSVRKKLVESGPLGERGWCFQERQLSPRVLHFTSYMLVWECRTCMATEDRPETGLQPVDNFREADVNKAYDLGVGMNALRIFDPASTESTKSREPQGNIYDRWLDAVENYSARDLTSPSDRFPALSGLAKAFAGKTHDTYLAGIWRGDFHRGLLWHRSYMGSAPARTLKWSRPSEYRAPSWSWASLEGPVNAVQLLRSEGLPHMQNLSNLSQLRFLDATITPTNPRYPYGTLSAATLRVSGRVKRAISFLPWKRNHFHELIDYEDAVNRGPVNYNRIGRICFDIPGDAVPQVVYCLNVVDYGLVRGPDPLALNNGLALVVENAAERKFRRVGVVEWNDENWFTGVQLTTLSIV